MVLGAFAGGCDESASSQDFEDAERGVWEDHGKADGIATCRGACGGQAEAGCWCDDACMRYGDCCPDLEAVCEAGESGGGSSGGMEEPDLPSEAELVAAFGVSACEGPALTAQDVYGLISSGATETELGVYRLKALRRVCNDFTGCTSWTQTDAPIDFEAAYGEDRLHVGTTRARIASSQGDVVVDFEGASTWCEHPLDGGPVECSFADSLVSGDSYDYGFGQLGRDCLNLVAFRAVPDPSEPVNEEQTAVLLRADHGVERDALDPELVEHFSSTKTVSVQCAHRQWGSRYTCQGAYDYTTLQERSIDARIENRTVVLDEAQGIFGGTSAEGSFRLSNVGRAVRSAGDATTTVTAYGKILKIDHHYYRDYGPIYSGCPSRGNEVTCTALVVVD